MSKKQKIVSIEIQLQDYEPIKFTMDEARELYEQLHSLFGEKEQHTHWHTYPWWNKPYYQWVGNAPISDGAIYCNDSNDTMTVASSSTGMQVTYSAQ